MNDYKTANTIIDQGGEALTNYSSTTLPVIAGHAIAVNLPALLIVAAVTWLLIYGIRESARTNNVIVITKVAVVVFVIAFGAFLIHPTNWHPFVPTGIGGVMSGAAIVFFAFIGFDAVSTTAEETRNPQRDMPIGIIASLIICTVLYVLMAAVITGMRKYTTYFGDPAAVATAFAGRAGRKRSSAQARSLASPQFSLSFSWPAPHFHGDGADGLLPQYFCPHPSAISDTAHRHDWTGVFVRRGVAAIVDSVPWRTHEFGRFSPSFCFPRQSSFYGAPTESAAPFPRPMVRWSNSRCSLLLRSDVKPAPERRRSVSLFRSELAC